MADTYTTNLNLTKPEPGAAEDTWGISLNSDLDTLDAIFSSSGTQVNLNPNQVNFADGKKAIFGTDSDLQIYHDGSNSYIAESGTGSLLISGGANVKIQSPSDEDMIIATANGAVTLYHNNSPKIATTSTGIDVTGDITATSALPNIYLMESDSTDLNSRFALQAGVLYLTTSSDNKLTATNRLGVNNSTGDISFYDDTGTTQGLFWDASTERLGLGTTSPAYNLSIEQDSPTLQLKTTNTTGTNIILFSDSSSNFVGNIKYNHSDNALSFSTTSTANERMRIDSNGNVGIGTDSPNEILSVRGNIGLLANDSINWRLGETSTVRASISTVRSGNAHRITFGTSATTGTATEKMRLDEFGNVGIGTSSPSSVLEIADSGVELKITDTRNITWTAGDTVASLGFYSDDASGSSGAANNLPRGAIDLVTTSIYGSTHDMVFRTRGDTSTTASEKLRITSNGSVGIGTDSPSAALNIVNSGLSTQFRVSNTVSDATTKYGAIVGSHYTNAEEPITGMLMTSSSSATGGRVSIGGGISSANAVNEILFYTAANNTTLTGSEAGRFDSSGNLLVGKTAADISTDGIELGTRVESTADGTYPLRLNRRSSDGEIINFRKDGTSVGSIRVKSSILSIQTTTAGASYGGLRFGDGTIQPVDNNGNLNNGVMDLGSSAFRFKRGYFSDQIIINGTSPNIRLIDTDTNADSQISASSGFGALVLKADYNAETAGSFIGFEVDGSEAGRFDESGNLLVGTTDDSIAGSSTETGINANAIGALVASRTSGASGFFNRLSTDGIIVDLRRDGTTVGQLRGRSGDLIIQTGITGLRFNDANNAIHPVIANGTVSDNATDLGLSNSRFKDIYATNGTIQTSDINEKQDIEDLSEAETRVAVAAKGLLKKYRWKSAVADKGNDARIHFGIMAQDLENAFANEGLDAGDYGMFISSTWTDEATGEEKTRLGVRYNELLAFIIAAI